MSGSFTYGSSNKRKTYNRSYASDQTVAWVYVSPLPRGKKHLTEMAV